MDQKMSYSVAWYKKRDAEIAYCWASRMDDYLIKHDLYVKACEEFEKVKREC